MVVSSHGAGKQDEIHIPIPSSIYVYTYFLAPLSQSLCLIYSLTYSSMFISSCLLPNSGVAGPFH